MIGVGKSMWCLVTLPDSIVFEVNLDPKSDAQECLQKVLDKLDIIESDYFGLQYVPSKGESATWLNLRNPLDHQLSGPPPYRLRLKVKFYVAPHRLLQKATLQQFYQNVKQDFIEDGMRFITEEQIVSLASLIAQAEYGDSTPTSTHSYAHLIPMSKCEDENLMSNTKEMHSKLNGLSTMGAVYRALQVVSECRQHYGVEHFQVGLELTSLNTLYGVKETQQPPQVKGTNQHHVGVGPEGVTVYNAKWKHLQMFPYPRVHRITNYSRSFRLMIFNDDGSDFPLDFRLPTKTAANALYRCMTEMYCFYLCETVRDNVVTQFSRDLKGTLASLFNENSSVGKKYTFDIQRTSNEAYDHYRRVLYKAGCTPKDLITEGLVSNTSSLHECSHTDVHTCGTADCQNIKEQLQQMQDAVLCCLCVDRNLSVVFKPCHHVVCCSDCAERVDKCPVCRQTIEQRQSIYMPSLPARSDLVARL